MSRSLNKVQIIGNVIKDPEMRSTQSGDKIGNIVVATSEQWTDKASGEKKEKSEFHKVVVFNKHLIGVVESYIKKGSKLYVEGALQTRKWAGSDGVDRYSTEIVLQQFGGVLILLDGRGDDAAAPAGKAQAAKSTAATSDRFDDDIPF